MKEITVKINGSSRTGIARVGQTLLEFLRNELYCTEVKQGCGRGDCGACSIIMDGKLVDSCLILALQAEGSDIITGVGLGTKEHPHPIQKAFIENGAFQCGFCTPGMTLAAKVLIEENPHPTEDEVKRGLSGNLCRCTGYVKVIDAVSQAAQEMGKAEEGTDVVSE